MSVIAGLALAATVVPARNPDDRSLLGTGDRAPIDAPAIISVPGYTREPSHVHIQRPLRDYFSPYSECGRACGTTEGNHADPEA